MMRLEKPAIIFIAMLILFTGSSAFAQTGEDVSTDFIETFNPEESFEDKQVQLLLDRAESYYSRSLGSLDDADILRSTETLEELLSRYPESIGSVQAYFILGELLTSKIQGPEACKAAINVYEDYLTLYDWRERAWEALYNIASIQYLYLKDYTAAKLTIERLFTEFSIALDSDDDSMKQAKLLYAKIMHKNGNLGEEVRALDEIGLVDPMMAQDHQIRLANGIKSNRILKDKNDRFIFMGTWDKDTKVKLLINHFRTAERNVSKLLPGIKRDFPLDIYLYEDSEYFFETTNRKGSFGNGPDAHIFHLKGHPMEPLYAQVYAFIINNQPSKMKITFLESGFINAFGDISLNLDTAALELGISADEFKGEMLFDNGQFPYFSEKESIAAAFVNYLMTNYPVDKFYRIFRMMEGSVGSDIKLAGDVGGFDVDIARIKPSTLIKGFETVYEVDFETVTSRFMLEMSDRRKVLEQKLESRWALEPKGKVTVKNSTPEDVLISYFSAIKAGEYDKLIDCTTGSLKDVLEDAKKMYKERGILENVEKWKMAVPYMDVKIEVVARNQTFPDFVVFRVNLLKDGIVMEKRDLVAVKKKNKWYISEN